MFIFFPFCSDHRSHFLLRFRYYCFKNQIIRFRWYQNYKKNERESKILLDFVQEKFNKSNSNSIKCFFGLFENLVINWFIDVIDISLKLMEMIGWFNKKEISLQLPPPFWCPNIYCIPDWSSSCKHQSNQLLQKFSKLLSILSKEISWVLKYCYFSISLFGIGFPKWFTKINAYWLKN